MFCRVITCFTPPPPGRAGPAGLLCNSITWSWPSSSLHHQTIHLSQSNTDHPSSHSFSNWNHVLRFDTFRGLDLAGPMESTLVDWGGFVIMLNASYYMWDYEGPIHCQQTVAIFQSQTDYMFLWKYSSCKSDKRQDVTNVLLFIGAVACPVLSAFLNEISLSRESFFETKHS